MRTHRWRIVTATATLVMAAGVAIVARGARVYARYVVAKLSARAGGDIEKVAIVVDIREDVGSEVYVHFELGVAPPRRADHQPRHCFPGANPRSKCPAPSSPLR